MCTPKTYQDLPHWTVSNEMDRGQYSLTDIEYFCVLSSMPHVAKMDVCDGRTMGIIKKVCTLSSVCIKVKGSKVGVRGTRG